MFMIISYRTNGNENNYDDSRLIELKKQIKHLRLSTEIYKLKDHKGLLSVYWFGFPTVHEKDIILKLWESLNDYQIEHYSVEIIETKL